MCLTIRRELIMRSSISIDDEPNGFFALLQIFFGMLVIFIAGLGDTILAMWSRLA